MSITYYSRLEPATRTDDLAPGVAAAVFDAAWLLARQWQLGELLGEDGGSPISVRHTSEVLRVNQLRPAGKDPVSLAADALPWEAIAEAAPVRSTEGWPWRLRVDVGRELSSQLRAHGAADRVAAITAAFSLDAPGSSPIDADAPGAAFAAITAGRVPDGEAAYSHWQVGLRQAPPDVAALAGVTVDDALRDALVAWLRFCDAIVLEPAADAWEPTDLLHRCQLEAHGAPATVELRADSHRGGALDWWAFDATTRPGDPGATAEHTDTRTTPTRVQFRGMPNPRWWELDDAAIDLGGVQANPADLARMAVLEFAFAYGNDHFAIPVRLPAGSLCRTTNLLVSDTFGVTVRIEATSASSHGSARWTMFALSTPAGDVAEWFCLPLTAADQLSSAAIEEIVCARDEMANVAWAIERLVEGPTGEPVDRGRELRSPPALQPPAVDHTRLRWSLGSTVPPFWFPLVVDPADPSVFEVQTIGTAVGEAPKGRLLELGARIATDAIPREGRRLRREFAAARGADGTTAVWSRRRATVARGEASSALAFDRAEPVDVPSA
ncbi:MAG: hypothetical protein V7607_2566 [Solirubrobacteraceae bacterium]